MLQRAGQVLPDAQLGEFSRPAGPNGAAEAQRTASAVRGLPSAVTAFGRAQSDCRLDGRTGETDSYVLTVAEQQQLHVASEASNSALTWSL